MELKTVPIHQPEGVNIILGQSHFIKTVEDIHEALVTAVSGIEFGLAFCEASGPALIRTSGTDRTLIDAAAKIAMQIGAGHSFTVLLGNAFPINVLNAVKAVPEVCRIYCATANPLQVVVAETDQGRAILGVVDGVPPKGVETESDVADRMSMLREFGYKLG
ncbi:MAG: adenosine-specific kinase [Anaerolineales bacterium]